MLHSSVTIQIAPESAPSTPSWFTEMAAFAQVLSHRGTLKAIQEQVRFARTRFGTYELIDFAVVLIGYVLSGEPTLLSFDERLTPFAEAYMALFGRNQLPHRSTLSRFLAALDQLPQEALRTLFQKDLLARSPFPSPGSLFDRTGAEFLVVDVNGTRATARQRALPQTDALPAPHRRFDQVCAPGYQGRKRGEVVRTRTVVLQIHTHQLLGTFGNPGNGDYRGELRRAIGVITSYATRLRLSLFSILVRLDGLYGDAAPLLDVLSTGLGVITRSRAYRLLNLDIVKSRLLCDPDQVSTHPESGMRRSLYDCASVPLTPTGPEVRLVVATHPATESAPAVGVERDGTVYELFVSTLPSPVFAASDVLDLYLHRGSFETVLADEDDEQGSDRWYSHTPCGQEFAQILSQWIWNLRLELGQALSPSELRTTEFAPARAVELARACESAEPLECSALSTQESVAYGPPQWARPSFTHGFPGSAFTPQLDGTLRCPANPDPGSGGWFVCVGLVVLGTLVFIYGLNMYVQLSDTINLLGLLGSGLLFLGGLLTIVGSIALNLVVLPMLLGLAATIATVINAPGVAAQTAANSVTSGINTFTGGAANPFGQSSNCASIPAVTVPSVNGLDIVNKTLTGLHLPSFAQINQWGHVFFSGGALTLGCLLLGFALLQAKSFPRTTCYVLMAAGGLNLVSQFFTSVLPVVTTLTGVLLFVTLAWLGVSILLPETASKFSLELPFLPKTKQAGE